MAEMLFSMMKEEWRIHTSLFGNAMFVLFPVMMSLFSCGITLLLPILQELFTLTSILLIIHALFGIFGLGVGAFGLMSREFMNRRFGQASLIAYSSRSLPVSDKWIFLNFFLKDIIYYFFLWILPFTAGFFIGTLFIGIPMAESIYLLMSLTFSFLIGISVSFFLSTLYVHSSKLVLAMTVVAAILAARSPASAIYSFPPYVFFVLPSLLLAAKIIAFVIVTSAFSILFLRMDYDDKKHRFKNRIESMSRILHMGRFSCYIAKDFLDIKRSQGGFGKLIFSYLAPLGMIYVIVKIFTRLFPETNFLILFSIFVGILSTSIYSWLTEFEVFNTYAFLPVNISTVIKSKIISFFIMNLVSPVLIVYVAYATGTTAYLAPALLTLVSISVYTLAVTIYLTGLHPNLYLYSGSVFSKYLALNSAVVMVFLFLSVFSPFFLIFSPVIIPFSFFLLGKSYSKWDRMQPVVI